MTILILCIGIGLVVGGWLSIDRPKVGLPIAAVSMAALIVLLYR